jgi:uncharacterized protein (DUF2249 family)
VAAVSEAVTAGRPHEAAVAELVAYLAEEVLPHAAAEEETMYPAAAHGGLTRTVSEMIAEHNVLSAAAERLARAPDGATAAGQAGQISELFTAHVTKENDILLPALLADRDADLTTLLAEMHRRSEEAGQSVSGSAGQATDPPDSPGSDPDLDVRDLPPAQRHEAIFAAYQALAPSTGFVLVNDHDPRPLRYQFEAEHPGEFTWDYLETGPKAWRVRIGRARCDAAGSARARERILRGRDT